MSDQEHADRVNELRKGLAEAKHAVDGWDESKKEDASVTMYSRSLAALYESPLKLKCD
jgi:hypothetical protein